MSKKIINFNEYKNNKQKIQEEDDNTKLFKQITGKPILLLDKEELKAFEEIKVKFGFTLTEDVRLTVVEFREEFYVIHYLPDLGLFEYLGTMGEIIRKYLGWS